MATFISIIIFIACILLILIVLVQNPKGGGLASEFSAADRIGGVQQTADFLEKATWTLAVGVMALTLIQAVFVSSGGEQEVEKDPLEQVIDGQMDQDAPVMPQQGGGQQGGGAQGDQPQGAPPQGEEGESPSLDEQLDGESSGEEE